MSFWSSGFWDDGFWAGNFWKGDVKNLRVGQLEAQSVASVLIVSAQVAELSSTINVLSAEGCGLSALSSAQMASSDAVVIESMLKTQVLDSE